MEASLASGCGKYYRRFRTQGGNAVFDKAETVYHMLYMKKIWSYITHYRLSLSCTYRYIIHILFIIDTIPIARNPGSALSGITSLIF